MVQYSMNLEQYVQDYQISDMGAELVRQSNIVLLAGIAGAGKDTIKKALLRQSSFQDIVSHTTRQPRSNSGIDERDGVDYHFINLEVAQAMVAAHDFVEVKYVHGTVYGTSLAELRDTKEADRIAVTDVDVQGIDEYKNISSDVIAIFILPPNYSTWVDRLRSRYTTVEEFEQEFPKRRASAVRELAKALEVSYYHFVINDSLERAIRISAEIAMQNDIFNRHDDEARLVARDLLADIQSHA